jgi:hypothetical protein
MLRKLEQGVLVTVVLALITFAFWLGGLQKQLEKLEPKQAAEAAEKAVKEVLANAGTVPKGTIVAWYVSSGPVPAGWRICDGAAGSGTPNLSGRFLRGTTEIGQVGTTGGSERHSHADVVQNGRWLGDGFNGHGQNVHGRTDEQSNLPPFVDVIYIMKI